MAGGKKFRWTVSYSTPKKIADMICNSSGRGALCATTLPCKLAPTRSSVTWVYRSENMTAEVYWNYVKKQSELKKCPMAIRQGGNSDLGSIGANPQDFPDERAKHWIMKGVPHHWDFCKSLPFLLLRCGIILKLEIAGNLKE